MANVKISELPVDSSLSGSEIVPIVDGATTRRTTLAAIAQFIGTTPGAPGQDGADGREIQLQKSATHIQWRYVGEATWTNLVALSEITGPQGPSGTGTGTSGPVSFADIEGDAEDNASLVSLLTAQIAEALADTPVTTGSPTTISNIWVGTQTQYDAIASKSATTLYHIIP